MKQAPNDFFAALYCETQGRYQPRRIYGETITEIRREKTLMNINMTRWFLLATLISVLQAGVIPASEEEADLASAYFPDIKVSYKLDARLTQGLYMGDSWVSPATYTLAGEGRTCIVEAGVYGLDPGGKPGKLSPTWIPSDPGMVSVSRHQGNAVKITVKRTGQCSLTVTYGGTTKKLAIKAVRQNGALQVNITQ
jgi:hypothetical protein